MTIKVLIMNLVVNKLFYKPKTYCYEKNLLITFYNEHNHRM